MGNKQLRKTKAPSGKMYSDIWELPEDKLAAMALDGDCDDYIYGSDDTEKWCESLREVLDAVKVPMFGRTQQGELCYANQKFRNLLTTDHHDDELRESVK